MVILVGHDGSDFSQAALRWALTQASISGSPVTLARAWTIRSAPTPATFERGFVPPAAEFEKAVVDALAADTASVRAEFPDVDVTLRAVRGPAVNALLSAAADADMLVLGPRGIGGFKGLLLGSVSEQLIQHAPCTTVVVREKSKPAASADRTAPLD
jgi:nucleotide-binding universal stress UspA family protein